MNERDGKAGNEARDLVERLRAIGDDCSFVSPDEAAAEIERLRAALAAAERERDALRHAILTHRMNLWGSLGVQHPEDTALYAAMERQR